MANNLAEETSPYLLQHKDNPVDWYPWGEEALRRAREEGWPLNAFVTPEQVPFYAGTYFPPTEGRGMPSWRRLLGAVVEAWENRRDEIRAGGERVAERLRGGALLSPSSDPIDARELDAAVERLRESYDARHGGFGGAAKVPPPPTVEVLLPPHERGMSAHTLPA